MITKVINVNLHQPIYERLTAKQGDIASRYLLFHLLDGDKPFDLSNRTVRVYARKPDKTEIFNDLTINDASKGYCTLELTSQCLASAGVVKMELYISESGKILTSIPFELEVIACINTANGVVSTNEFSALEIALGSLQDYDNLRSEIIQARKGYGTVGKRLDTIENKVYDYGFIPQCPLPCKYGDNENSYKLVIKNNSNEYLVIQKTNKGYLKYTLKRGIGDSSYSVGQKWELLRLFNVEKCLETFVWLEPNAISGTLLKTIAPSDFNGVESNLLPKPTSNNICDKQGITLFELQASQQAEFYIPKVYNNKFSIKYLANNNRSENVEFYINNVLVKTINARNNDATGCYQDLEFNVPFTKNTTSGTWTLKMINKDATNKFGFIGFNFKSLGEYKGEYIDSYKIYPLASYFINTIGANDYAIRDKDLNKWCGSYHGGEILLWNKIKWNTTSDYGRLEYAKESEFDLISNKTFTLIKDFTIYQQTDINSKAKMLSIFDFNVNGTVNMSFSLYDNVINARDIYTQMVCSDPNFKSLIYPELKSITIDSETSFNNVIGKVVQKNGTTNDKITIRHDVFTNTYNTKGSFIVNDSSNSKVYYGVVSDYTDGVNIPHLNFNKAIDFEINTL